MGAMRGEKLEHLEAATRDLVINLLYYDRKENEDLSIKDIEQLQKEFPDLEYKIIKWFSDELIGEVNDA